MEICRLFSTSSKILEKRPKHASLLIMQYASGGRAPFPLGSNLLQYPFFLLPSRSVSTNEKVSLWYSVNGAQLMPSGKQNRVIALSVFSSSSFWNLNIASLLGNW